MFRSLCLPPYLCVLGDTESVIHGVRSMVRKANGITSEVLDGLNPIQTDLGRIKDSYGSTRHEDFSNALADANNSGIRMSSRRSPMPRPRSIAAPF